MMNAVAFDTLEFATTLKESGVPERQAEAQARAFAKIFQVNLEQLATREQVEIFRVATKKEFDDVKDEFTAVRQEMKEEFAAVRGYRQARMVRSLEDESEESEDARPRAMLGLASSMSTVARSSCGCETS